MIVESELVRLDPPPPPGAFAAWTERFIADHGDEREKLLRQKAKEDAERKIRLQVLFADHLADLTGMEIGYASVRVSDHGICSMVRDGYEITRKTGNGDYLTISRLCPRCLCQIRARSCIFLSGSPGHQKTQLVAALMALRDENDLPEHVCREDVCDEMGGSRD